MDKVIYFDNNNQTTDLCSGNAYTLFLEYAFSKTDFFMLVYVNYYNKGYTKKAKAIMKELEPFKIKSRANPSWPGTPGTICPNTTYKVVFYKNNPLAKSVLSRAYCLSDWTAPQNPQDLAFFKGNQCWFYSVGHEKIAAIIRADEEDLCFVEANGLAKKSSAQKFTDYFLCYDEKLL